MICHKTKSNLLHDLVKELGFLNILQVGSWDAVLKYLFTGSKISWCHLIFLLGDRNVPCCDKVYDFSSQCAVGHWEKNFLISWNEWRYCRIVVVISTVSMTSKFYLVFYYVSYKVKSLEAEFHNGLKDF